MRGSSPFCYQCDMDIRTQLQVALRTAMKARDAAVVSALRSALSAIGNAEAVPVPGGPSGDHRYVAGSAGVLGAGEAQRRMLTEQEVAGIVRAEITQRQAAATQYEAAGHGDRASRLRHEAEAIESAIRSANTPGL